VTVTVVASPGRKEVAVETTVVTDPDISVVYVYVTVELTYETTVESIAAGPCVSTVVVYVETTVEPERYDVSVAKMVDAGAALSIDVTIVSTVDVTVTAGPDTCETEVKVDVTVVSDTKDVETIVVM